jgi:hypothetical protein
VSWRLWMCMTEPIHITVPGSPGDPRFDVAPPPGIIIHYAPDLRPEDLEIVNGIPVTSVARTLIDCAEETERDELRAMFLRARELGILDMELLRDARARIEWRPSLEMLDELIDEFS